MYLLLRLKKGKGNQSPVFDTQSSVERRKMLAHKISINGETVDLEHDKINIHDFAEFEKTDQLIPEFRFSIKSKSSAPFVRQENLPEVEDDAVFQDKAPKKTKSFQDIARQVYLMENALSKWPRRPRSRHHSSSSEDLAEDDRSRDGVDPDEVSVHTDVSELSETEQDSQIQDRTLTNTNLNSHTTEDNELRKRSSVGASLGKENGNEASGPQKTDLSEKQNISVHERGVNVHEHDRIKSKDLPTNESKNKESSRRKKRCPFCVVL